jgi:hypothetical protein
MRRFFCAALLLWAAAAGSALFEKKNGHKPAFTFVLAPKSRKSNDTKEK